MSGVSGAWRKEPSPRSPLLVSEPSSCPGWGGRKGPDGLQAPGIVHRVWQARGQSWKWRIGSGMGRELGFPIGTNIAHLGLAQPVSSLFLYQFLTSFLPLERRIRAEVRSVRHFRMKHCGRGMYQCVGPALDQEGLSGVYGLLPLCPWGSLGASSQMAFQLDSV